MILFRPPMEIGEQQVVKVRPYKCILNNTSITMTKFSNVTASTKSSAEELCIAMPTMPFVEQVLLKQTNLASYHIENNLRLQK
jgi:hypothetical protein